MAFSESIFLVRPSGHISGSSAATAVDPTAAQRDSKTRPGPSGPLLHFAGVSRGAAQPPAMRKAGKEEVKKPLERGRKHSKRIHSVGRTRGVARAAPFMLTLGAEVRLIGPITVSPTDPASGLFLRRYLGTCK